MNAFAALILGALLFRYGIELIAGTLNLRRLAPHPPPGFEDVYDAESYATSQRYTRERARLDLVESTVGLLALLLFWFLDGFDRLDLFFRGFGHGGVLTGTAYLSTLLLAGAVLSLPFRVYGTFVLEERFGFNRTTPGVFLADLAKSLLLSVTLGLPLIAGILWILLNTGDAAWLMGWIAVSTFLIVVQVVAPRLIMPLFHTYRPLDDGPLRQSILEYAGSVDFNVDDVFVIDGSRRSTRANAFFTGLGRSRRVALFDTLVDRHPEAETVAVLAHEVGHYKLRHIPLGLAVGIAHLGLMFFLLHLVLASPGLYDAFGMTSMSVHAGLVFFLLLVGPVELLLSLALNALSRRHEFQADAFAARTTGQPEAMIGALKRLARENLVNLTPHPLYVALHHSHPPLPRRIAALQEASATSPHTDSATLRLPARFPPLP